MMFNPVQSRFVPSVAFTSTQAFSAANGSDVALAAVWPLGLLQLCRLHFMNLAVNA